jgi:hypothetical protein
MYQQIAAAFEDAEPREFLSDFFWLAGVLGLAASAAMIYSVFAVHAARLGAELGFVGKTALTYEVLISMPIVAVFGYLASDILTLFWDFEIAPKKGAMVTVGISTLGLSIALYLIDFGVIYYGY